MLSTDQLEYTGYWNLIKSNPRKGVLFMEGVLSNPKTAEELLSNLNVIRVIASSSENFKHDKKIIDMVMTSKYRDKVLVLVAEIFYPNQNLNTVLNDPDRQAEINRNRILKYTLGEYSMLAALPVLKTFNIDSSNLTFLDDFFTAPILQKIKRSVAAFGNALYKRILENSDYITACLTYNVGFENSLYDSVKSFQAIGFNPQEDPTEKRKRIIREFTFINTCINSAQFIQKVFLKDVPRDEHDSYPYPVKLLTNPWVLSLFKNSRVAMRSLSEMQKGANSAGKMYAIFDQVFRVPSNRRQIVDQFFYNSDKTKVIEFAANEIYLIQIENVSPKDANIQAYVNLDMKESYAPEDAVRILSSRDLPRFFLHFGSGCFTLQGSYTSCRVTIYTHYFTLDDATQEILEIVQEKTNENKQH